MHVDWFCSVRGEAGGGMEGRNEGLPVGRRHEDRVCGKASAFLEAQGITTLIFNVTFCH